MWLIMPNYPDSLSEQINKRQQARADSPAIESPSKVENERLTPRSDSPAISSSAVVVNNRQAERSNSPNLDSLSKIENKRQQVRENSPTINSPLKVAKDRQTVRDNSPAIDSPSIQIDKRQTARDDSPFINSTRVQENKRRATRSNSAELQSITDQTNKRQQVRENSPSINSDSVQIDKRQAARSNSESLQSLSDQTNKRQAARGNSPSINSDSVIENKKSQTRSNSPGHAGSLNQLEKNKTERPNSPGHAGSLNALSQKEENNARGNSPWHTASLSELSKNKNAQRPNSKWHTEANNTQTNKRTNLSGGSQTTVVTDDNGNIKSQESFLREANESPTTVQSKKSKERPNSKWHDESLNKVINRREDFKDSSQVTRKKNDDGTITEKIYSKPMSESPNTVSAKKGESRTQSAQKAAFGTSLSSINDVLWANTIYNRQDIQWYVKFNRFGALDPYNALSGTREYIFFTKPDLHIVEQNTTTLNSELSNQPFFVELKNRYPSVITQLQSSNGYSSGNSNPFMTILSNSVKNTLEIPAISAGTVDTPATIYGTSYDYRGWGFSSDEKIEFSLEFEDSKYLEIYNLVKAYEEYERLKHIGLVTPPNKNYIFNKVLHDQFSVYKFIVEDDGETIIYYAKLWGVFFKNVPRDAFSDMKVEGGLTYAIDFQAAFIDDMNPTILTDFNQLITPYVDKYKTNLPIYNIEKRMIDGRWAGLPMIAKQNVKGTKTWNGPNNMSHIYKLKWRV